MLIAVASENGEVFQHFGHTPEFTVYEIEGELSGGSVCCRPEIPGTALWPDFCGICVSIC